MPRPFDFTSTTRRDAYLRQFGCCAVCGDDLNDTEDHAHHIVPNQVGKPSRKEDGFLRTIDNCVVLCYDCHEAVHDGNYKTGPVPGPEYYRFSHGRDFVKHQQWLSRVKPLADAQWDRAFPPSRTAL